MQPRHLRWQCKRTKFDALDIALELQFIRPMVFLFGSAASNLEIGKPRTKSLHRKGDVLSSGSFFYIAAVSVIYRAQHLEVNTLCYIVLSPILYTVVGYALDWIDDSPNFPQLMDDVIIT